MPEIETITVEGFKSIASLEQLKLGAINVLIGANGSGKSNFIDVFSLLQAIRGGHLPEYVIKAGGAEKVLHFGSKVTKYLKIDISLHGAPPRVKIALKPTDDDRLDLLTSFVMNSNAYDREDQYRWRLYHFHDTSSTSPMKKTADLNDNRYLRSDGANIAAFLYFLHEKHAPAYSLIRRSVQLIAPFFDDFQLEPQRLNPDKILFEWRHKNTDAYFNAASLSDGTLRFIALATLFMQPEELRPSVILVDEPELGLHPYAITMLAAMVKQASVNTQVILSTQSPILLDHFQPEDVLVAELVKGATQLSRLDAERLANWLENYSLGQLWEKNELGGRPGGG